MGAWVPSPYLLPGEVVLFAAAANHLVSRRSIGGKVTVTDQRLLFLANRLDNLTGGRSIDVARSTITSTRALEPGLQATRKRGFAASIRTQLAVEWPTGTAVLVVSDLEALQTALTPSRP